MSAESDKVLCKWFRCVFLNKSLTFYGDITGATIYGSFESFRDIFVVFFDVFLWTNIVRMEGTREGEKLTKEKKRV
jgi:hypothetical protein